MKILVTGAAGFIGFHTCLKLVNQGHEVYGIDNINNYYDPKLKFDRLNELGFNEAESKIFKNLPPQLPALLYAVDIYKRAEKANLLDQGDWSESNITDFASELDEETAGRAFFEWVGACKKAGLDPESALRKFASNQVNQLEND